ncbi:CoA-binding protein [Bacillus sp. JCM 19034]|uniref:CoA-binding protein n=1 Tax=Bacillus sp. JCM 19034 TaxID=1481928 RepID=UPI0007835A44|nr:CoA-binding protein [Bacillus sp. JCM 19034]
MHNRTDQQMKTLFQQARRIAVVGLSNNPERTSYQVARIMQNAGYEIIPVNPMIDETLGEKAVLSLREISGTVDIVNVFRRSEYLPEIAKDTIDIQAHCFWAQLGISNDEAYSLLEENGIMTVMNRCIKVEYNKTIM